MKHICQRDIYWADLNPIQGSEQAGKRPVVVISGDTLNEHLPVCIVCPLSSQIKHYNTCTVITPNKTNKLQNDSEVITFQIRTLSQVRLTRKVGTITKPELQDIINKVGQLLTY